MGCTGSRLCKAEQQDEIFDSAAKEMLRRCIEKSVASTDSLDRMKIPLPPKIDDVLKLCEDLRKVSGMAKSHLTKGKGGVGATDAARKASGDGGMLQGLGGVEKDLFSKAAEFVDMAAEALGAGIGAAAEKAFVIAADGLEQCVKDLEGPFNFAGRGFVLKSREDVVKVYCGIIEGTLEKPVEGKPVLSSEGKPVYSKLSLIEAGKPGKPVELVRGEAPHGPAQYKACPSDAISKELLRQKATDLAEALKPLAIDTLARNKIQEDWDSLMWKYQQANTKLKEYIQSEGFQQVEGASEFELATSLPEGPIKFELNQYIVEETVKQLAVLMGEEEAKLRAAPPVGEGVKPITFHLCFSNDLDGHLTLGKRLPRECYESRDK